MELDNFEAKIIRKGGLENWKLGKLVTQEVIELGSLVRTDIQDHSLAKQPGFF